MSFIYLRGVVFLWHHGFGLRCFSQNSGTLTVLRDRVLVDIVFLSINNFVSVKAASDLCEGRRQWTAKERNNKKRRLCTKRSYRHC